MAAETVECKVDLARTASPFTHYEEMCVGSGHAALALRADWQAQLWKCHEELGCRYVRFHGLLSDDMSVVLGRPERPEYHFRNVDLVFDFLQRIGMRPFVELSFMPTLLASGPQTAFHYKANVTPPLYFAQWEDLIRSLVQHLADRYGREEVAQWFFEVWNQPNLPFCWAGTQEQYFELYRRSAAAVKSVDAAFRVGGPASARDGWVTDLIAFCRESDAALDFISTHHYPTDFEAAPEQARLNQLEDFLALDMEDRMAASPAGILTKWAAETRGRAAGLPLYYTEWSSSGSCADHYHDEPYAAAFILKTLADNDGLVDGYAYRTFSDVFEEAGQRSAPFHGGFGLLTSHGIPKPAYHAFRFLHELGDVRLPVVGTTENVGALTVTRGPILHVLFWNYAPPRSDFPTAEVHLSVANADGPLAGTIERVDQDHANPRAAWKQMGSPQYPTADQIGQLRREAATQAEDLPVRDSDGEQVMRFSLPPWGSARITLSPRRM